MLWKLCILPNYWYKLDKCANIPGPLSISTQLYLLPGAIENSENPGKPLDSRAVTPRTFYHFSREKNRNDKCDKLIWQKHTKKMKRLNVHHLRREYSSTKWILLFFESTYVLGQAIALGHHPKQKNTHEALLVLNNHPLKALICY